MSSESHTEDPGRPMRLIGQVYRSFARLVDTPLRQLGFAYGQLPVLVTLKKPAPCLRQSWRVRRRLSSPAWLNC